MKSHKPRAINRDFVAMQAKTSKGKRVGESFVRPLLPGETKRTAGTLFAESILNQPDGTPWPIPKPIRRRSA